MHPTLSEAVLEVAQALHGQAIHLPSGRGPLMNSAAPTWVIKTSELGLSQVVITSVTRDDLPDGGAGHYARVVAELHQRLPRVRVELLIPDFNGSINALEKVLAEQPDILAHNMETSRGVTNQYFTK
jgi:lipoate synthase